MTIWKTAETITAVAVRPFLFLPLTLQGPRCAVRSLRE
jgi:hypothetical protein